MGMDMLTLNFTIITRMILISSDEYCPPSTSVTVFQYINNIGRWDREIYQNMTIFICEYEQIYWYVYAITDFY